MKALDVKAKEHSADHFITDISGFYVTYFVLKRNYNKYSLKNMVPKFYFGIKCHF